jgi:hypothetical protein
MYVGLADSQSASSLAIESREPVANTRTKPVYFKTPEGKEQYLEELASSPGGQTRYCSR